MTYKFQAHLPNEYASIVKELEAFYADKHKEVLKSKKVGHTILALWLIDEKIKEINDITNTIT